MRSYHLNPTQLVMLGTSVGNQTSTSAAFVWPGGSGTFKTLGAFNGAVLTLQVLGDDGVTWQALGNDTTHSAPSLGNFDCAAGEQLRVLVTGGGATGLFASVRA